MLSSRALLQHGVHEHLSEEITEQYSEDVILLCCDGVAWHKSVGLE